MQACCKHLCAIAIRLVCHQWVPSRAPVCHQGEPSRAPVCHQLVPHGGAINSCHQLVPHGGATKGCHQVCLCHQLVPHGGAPTPTLGPDGRNWLHKGYHHGNASSCSATFAQVFVVQNKCQCFQDVNAPKPLCRITRSYRQTIQSCISTIQTIDGLSTDSRTFTSPRTRRLFSSPLY